MTEVDTRKPKVRTQAKPVHKGRRTGAHPGEMRTKSSPSRAKRIQGTKVDQTASTSNQRFDAVMSAAQHSGLLGEKSARIASRISPALIEQAKKQTGIKTDTVLIEFALASIALDDDFGKTFRKTRGTIDPALKLGF